MDCGKHHSSGRRATRLSGLAILLLAGCGDVHHSADETQRQMSITDAGFGQLLKSCKGLNGGPVYPVQQYTVNRTIEAVDTRLDKDAENKERVRKYTLRMFELTLAKLNQCMAWEDDDPVDESVCAEFLRCQNEFVASEPILSDSTR